MCDLCISCKSTKCLNVKRGSTKVMKFLMGINETYYQIRSQILAIDPLLTIEKVYAMINQDETRRSIHIPITTEVSTVLTSTSLNNGQSHYKRGNRGGTRKGSNTILFVPTVRGSVT